MNALVKKEIRLLLPSFLAVLFLEVVLPWIGTDQDEAISFGPVIFFFGMILLAVDSFGREFNLGTFSSLMSQPVDRRQIWRTKIMVLFSAAALIFAAYFVSCELRLQSALMVRDTFWQPNSRILLESIRNSMIANFRSSMIASVAVLFVALTGGLWTALFLRQIAAAFWITFLAPAGVLVAVILCLPAKFADGKQFIPLL